MSMVPTATASLLTNTTVGSASTTHGPALPAAEQQAGTSTTPSGPDTATSVAFSSTTTLHFTHSQIAWTVVIFLLSLTAISTALWFLLRYTCTPAARRKGREVPHLKLQDPGGVSENSLSDRDSCTRLDESMPAVPVSARWAGDDGIGPGKHVTFGNVHARYQHFAPTSRASRPTTPTTPAEEAKPTGRPFSWAWPLTGASTVKTSRPRYYAGQHVDV